MKKQLPSKINNYIKAVFLLLAFFVFNTAPLFAQTITLNKTAVASNVCNQFDISLTVTGNPPPLAQDVILVIDRSGSMGGDPIMHAKNAAVSFVNNIFAPANNPTGNNRVGIVSYSTSGTLEIGLRNSTFQAAIIAEINSLVASGGTNIASAMDVADNEMTANGVFNCATGRSILLLTDGVTNRRLNGSTCSGTPSPPFPAGNSACMDDAISEGQGAQTTPIGNPSVIYNQKIFSVGLFGDISGNAQAAATYTLDQIQNGGLFTTEAAADLTGIYNTILGQLALAAKDAIVTDALGTGFQMVSGTLSDPVNASYNSGTNTITWDLGDVSNETRTLTYRIAAVGMQGCGIQNSGSSQMSFINASCNPQVLPFPNPQICVPCPIISDPVIDQVDCTKTINYSASFNPGDCTPFSVGFVWEFFLNNTSVGTVSGNTIGDLSGAFTYTGANPFQGDFRAELTYNGTYNNNCNLPPVTVDSDIQIYLPPNAPVSGGNQTACAATPIQTLTAVATVLPNQSVVWYDMANGGNVVSPTLNTIGSITYWAETVDNTSGCSSLSRTPVSLTLYNCAINIEKTASPNDPANCNPIAPGQPINYTFTVTNIGNVAITNVEVNDPLIDPVNPIPGPASGDTNNNNALDLNEVWTYNASYIVQQSDIITGQVVNTADVDGTVTGSSSSYNVHDEDSETVILCQNAEISITKASTSATGNCINFTENDIISYTFVVTNEGDVDISNVVVTDPILGGVIAGPASGDTNNNGVLNVGEVWNYAANYSVTQLDIDNGSVVNTSEVNGTTALGPVNDPSNQVTVLICQTPDIAIVKTNDQIPGQNNCVDLSEGDTVTYTFTVTNEGNLSIDNVVVTDPLVGLSVIAGPTGDTGADGILGLTEVWTYTATYVVTQDDVDAGQITNQATVNGLAMNPADTPVSDLSGSTTTTDDATVIVICQTPDIAIVKTNDQIPGQNNCVDLSEGDTVTYTFTVTNEGNLSIDNVVVTDPLVGLSVIAGPTGDTGADGILGLTEVWTYTATYVVTQDDVDAGQITNQATVNGLAMNPADTPVSDLSGSTTTTDDATVIVICQTPDIAIVKTNDQIPGQNNCVDLSEGDTVTYTFTVTNEGNLSIDNVVVTDPLVGLSVIAGPTGDTGADGILGLTEVWTYTATYVVTQDDVDAGQITNQATVNGLAMNPANTPVSDLSGSTTTTDDATVIVICQTPDIAIVKTNDQIPGQNNCVDLSEGDTVTYTFTVTNEGNLSIDNVVVTDPLVGLSVIAGPTGDTGADGILGLTEVWTYTATYVVTQDDVDAGQITNQATVNGLAMNPADTPVSDLSGSTTTTDDATVIVICQTPDIAIVKTNDQIPGQNNCVDLSEGDTVTYTFTVTNEGNLSIDNVVVTDPLVGLSVIAGPTGDTGADGILGLTEVWTYTATYVVTQDDVDAGQITNQATVNGLAMNPADTPVSDLSGSTTTTDDATVIVICQTPDIAIVKTNDQIPGQNNCVDLSEGDTVTYTFTVTNEGNLSIDNVVVTDPLVGLSVIAGPTGDTGADGILGLTEVWTYTATYVVTQDDVDAGQITNQATVNGLAMNPADTPVSDLSGSTTTTDDATVIVICQTPDIAIVKTNDQIPGQNNCVDLSEGDTVTYTFTVTNEGNLSIDNVVVTDPLVGLSVIAGPTGDTGADGILGLTEVWTYTATYVVTQDDVDAGQITNQATVNGLAMNPANTPVSDLSGSTTTTDDATVIVICQTPDIAIVKTNDQIPGQNNCVDLSEGDTVTYTFTVTNEGNLSIDNVVVTDPLVGLSVIAGPTGDTGADGILGLTEVWTYTATYVVTQDDVDAGQITNQATVNGLAMNPANTPVSDLSGSTTTTDDATVIVICQTPDIAIVKTNDQIPGQNNCVDLSEGDTVTYTFTVTNEGNLSIDNVVVTDPLVGLSVIAGPTGDTGADGILGLTEVWTYTATYVVTQDDVDAGQITNQATVNGLAMNPADTPVSDLSGSTTTTDDATVIVICQTPDIAIVKTNDQIPGQNNCVDLSEGDTVTYTFTVTNEGNLSIDNVVVTDPLVGLSVIAGPTGDTGADGILGLTEVWTYTATYVVTQDDVDAGQITNQATVNGLAMNPADTPVSDLSGSTTTTDDATVIVICQTPDIAIVKTNDQIPGQNNCVDLSEGDTVTYTFTVTNEGNLSIDNVVVTDPLVGLSVIAGPTGDTGADGILGLTEVWTYTATYVVTQDDVDAGQITNQATVNGLAMNPANTPVSDLSGSTTTTDDATVIVICQTPDIAIVKTHNQTPTGGNNCIDLSVGQDISYTFTVTNEGNLSIDNVVVTDPLPGLSAITFIGGDADNDQVLDLNEIWTYNAVYTVTQDDIDLGSITNQATVNGTAMNPANTPVSDISGSTVTTDDPTVIIICQNPAIAIVKEASYDDGGDCSDPGELINYTFTVTNEGNVSLSNIVVTDPLLGGVVAGPDSGDTDNDGELDVTEVWIYTGSYAITQDDIDNGEVINQATVTGIAPDQSQVSDLSGSTTTTDDETTTTLCQEPIIAIVKEASYDDGGDCSDPGELINYTFTVTNEGNVSLSNIVVTDPLLGGVVAGPDSGDTDNDGELDVTEVWIYTGSYAITQDDIDNGEVINQATVTGIAPDQSQVSDLSGSTTATDDETTTTLCQEPIIAIVKEASYDDGGDCSDPGELINYTFTVTNEGNVSLSNIVVTDPLLGGVVAGPDSGDTDNDGELDVTEVWIYTGSYAITQDDIDNGEVINQATVTGIAPDQSQVSDLSGSTTTTDDETTTTLCQEPIIAIVKEASYDDGGDCSDPGELINYTFTVTNEGNVSLSNIVVTDPLLGGVVAGPDSGDTDNDGELDVTEVWIYTGSYAITQDDIDNGEVINQATVTGIAPDQSQVSDLSGSTTTTDDETTTTLCQEPIIAIVKEASYDDGGDCSDPGELINYTFTVTNEGNVSLSNIVVTDPLLGGVVAGPDSGDTDNDGELDVTEVWIYTGSYAITQDDIDNGEVINQATVTGIAPDQSQVSDLSGSTTTTDDETTTTLCQEPIIAIVKEASYDDGGDCSDPGELINYTFTVTNEGNVSLSNIVVTDPLLGGVVAGPDSGDTDNDGELDVTEVWIYTGSYAITQDDIDNGEVINQATVTGIAPDQSQVSDLSGSTTTTDDETTTTLCQEPIIAIVKEASYDDGGDCSDPGELINYTFTVTNEGNVSLSNIVVTDPLLGGVVAGPDSGDTDNDGELDVTEVWIYTGSYAITQDDIDNGEVINQATVTGIAPDQSQVSDLSGSTTTTDDETTTTLCQEPIIAIVKEASYDDGGDCSDPGELINYTFTVTNEGNVSLSNIVVTDPLLGGVVAGPDSGDTDNDGELDVTEVWIYTGSYAITQDDIDNGEVINQATVTGIAPDQSQVSDLSGSTTTTDDETTTTLCQEPIIAIVKEASYDDGGDCSDPGELINYTFTVTNEGNVSLSNIVVTDPLLGGVVAGPDSGDTDNDGELDVTEVWIYTGSYAITQDDIDNGEVINQATVTGIAPDQSQVSDLSGSTTTTDDETTTTLCQNPAIAIIKTGLFVDVDGDKCADVGELIDYTFTVTNEGNVSLSSIEVNDPLLGGQLPGPDSGDTDNDGELDVTETWIYTGSYAITQIDIDNGEVVNQAVAKGASPLGVTVSDLSDDNSILEDDPTVTDICQEPVIAIIKTGLFIDEDGDKCADVGEMIDYTFTVTNLGNVSLSNIVVDDPLLGGPIAGPDSGDTDNDGELDVTETWIYTASYAITQVDIDAGQVINQATATGTAPDQSTVSDLSDNDSEFEDDPTETDLCQEPVIAIIKVGVFNDENGNGCADEGESIDYTFTVTNEGNVSLTNIIVDDPLLGGPIAGPDSGDTDNNGELGETEAWIYSGTYIISQSDIDNGNVTNQATASGTADGVTVTDLSDPNSVNGDSPTITDLCQDPSMSVTKSGVFNDDNGDQIPQPGETISYFFSVTNTGNVTLYNITLSDELPGIVLEGGPIAQLDPGEVDDSTFTATYAITEADIAAGEVINQAIGTGETIGGDEVSDTSDDPNDLTNVDPDGDGEPDDPTVTVIPNVLPANFEIFNGVTPDGDGLNDYFQIDGIEDYPINNVKIFNRWGVLVWETDGYGVNGNVFRGVSSGRSTVRESKELPTGTYFYILTFPGGNPGDNPGETNYSGYLYINR
ncbi:putative repeat protein (TIGR01451 family)/gliding motility-associated-like protein [Ulvibacter sp. MAR_2010_11]|uniref:DUF7507 domain-containing protein n=1 Tax=Ulvibacter sp. MAR_2010_11 TaxID=1250229 RepID=UPI000C2B8166|nr:gliding motility-associated C-terminal domain-containing protein [Ulvibacter sp. MAR_2010_11]PKA83670.1 putative repeat protein (TIGR01451 family)/gliding motility-associated-like protein [Ulvibacter sp. MAR_2010_11]